MKTSNKWQHSISLLTALFLLCVPGLTLAAQFGNLTNEFTTIFDGSVKNATATRLDEADRFVKIENSLELGYSNWLSDTIGVTVKGLFLYDAVYDVENDLHVADEDEYRLAAKLREGFVDLTFDAVDIRLGKQQVVWGKTDGFRITDLVNPLDLKEFGLADFIDSRIPLWMAKIDYYVATDFAFQFLVIPELEFTQLAHAGSEYALANPAYPAGVIPNVQKTDTPEEGLDNTEYGLRFSGYYEGWDFSVNYLYTWDDLPTVRKSLNPSTGVLTLSPKHERLHVVGGTFATVMLDSVVRGEVAAHLGKYFDVTDMAAPDMVVDKPFLNYALAVERDLFDISWLVQFLQEAILDYEDAISDDEIATTFTLRAAKSFINETLEFEFTAAYGVNDQEFLLRPALNYDLADSTKLTLGVDVFEGDDDTSLFGQFDDKDRFYAEVVYSF